MSLPSFRDRKIADLQKDIADLKAMQATVHTLAVRGNETSNGASMLDGVEVLLREAVMHYEAEIEDWEASPEKSA